MLTYPQEHDKMVFMIKKQHVLLVNPSYPVTFWSFKHALPFISKKASLPPLGLLTIAPLLPENWEKKLVDMSAEPLRDEDLLWADWVFLSATSIQRASALEVIQRCKAMKVPVVAGGPLFTTHPQDFPQVDHLVLDEGEITLPHFLEDLNQGKPQKIYRAKGLTDVSESPVPAWHLLHQEHYASMAIQYSRGCPFNCEFCDVILLFGRKVRRKTATQMIQELNALYEFGWRGSVFMVDDNFIGNKKALKKEVLPAIQAWQAQKGYPFTFYTQTSINLVDDPELMDSMVKAGFDAVFVGIESIHEESLEECNKKQNKNRDLLASIKTLQRAGLEVQGGFILGFDHDKPSLFEDLVQFIQKSGIVTAMVGILNAPFGTALYRRLKQERRIIKDWIEGNNTAFATNIIPKMGYHTLHEGYKKVLQTLYAPKNYYRRVMTLLREFQPKAEKSLRGNVRYLKTFLKTLWLMGIKEKGRWHYWKLLFWTIFTRPRLFPLAVTFSIYGYHFRRVTESLCQESG